MLLHERTAGHAGALSSVLSSPPILSRNDSLFLDFDGTLIELAEHPDAVIVDPQLGHVLRSLADRLKGRVAIVSGRSIPKIDSLLGDVALEIAVAGSHGSERRTPASGHITPKRPEELAFVQAAFEDFATRHGLVFEPKSLGAGLHYRAVPEMGPEVLEFAARVAGDHGLVLQPGKMMAEVRVPGDKGAALQAFMETPVFAGSRPLFLGDDVTDEDGFAMAAACGGAGVLIGEERTTAAAYRLPGVSAVRAWLAAGVESLG